jgi:hypothetical protein
MTNTLIIPDLGQLVAIIAWFISIIVILAEVYLVHQVHTALKTEVKKTAGKPTKHGELIIFIFPMLLCMMSISENVIRYNPFTSNTGLTLSEEINRLLAIPQVNLVFILIWIIVISIVATQNTIFKKILFEDETT